MSDHNSSDANLPAENTGRRLAPMSKRPQNQHEDWLKPSPRKCKNCGGFGHFAKTCKDAPGSNEAPPPPPYTREAIDSALARLDIAEGDGLVVPEVIADLLMLKRNTILRMARQGEIPHVRITQRIVRFDLGAVRAWLDGQRVHPATSPADGTGEAA